MQVHDLLHKIVGNNNHGVGFRQATELAIFGHVVDNDDDNKLAFDRWKSNHEIEAHPLPHGFWHW